MTPTVMAAPHFFSDELDGAKRGLRTLMRARLAGMAAGGGAGLGLVAHFPVLGLPPGAVVGGFWPINHEIDVRPLLQALHAAGHKVVLPETPKIAGPLVFRGWRPGCAMAVGRFGTAVPDGTVAVPEVILVPLLAFDQAGGRLGQGGGFYDRTLAANPTARAIGVGYAAQGVDIVPVGPHDRPLSAILTERGVVTPDLRK